MGEIVAPLCARDKQIGVSLPCSFEYKESCSWTKQAVRTYTPPEIFASATQKVSALDALTSTGIFKKAPLWDKIESYHRVPMGRQ